jgi:hypothetical protein
VKRKHARTLEPIFKRPVSANVRFGDAEALVRELGGEIDMDRAGSRVALVLFDELRVFHKPHPSPCMDKAAVAALRNWLNEHGVHP